MRKLWEMLRSCGVSPTHKESFRQEMDRLSRHSLRVIGIVEVVFPIAMALVQSAVMRVEPWEQATRHGVTAAIVVLGLATSGVARVEWGRNHARLVAGLSGWVAGGILIAGSLGLAGRFPGREYYIPAQVAAVLLVGVVLIPFQPLQTLALGWGLHGWYLGLSVVVARWGVFSGGDMDAAHHVFVFMLTLLSTALTAVVWRQREASWEAHQEALRVLQDLRHAQARALLSENAAALGRLAAALCHELNSPLGALTSAVDTLFILSDKQVGAGEKERVKLGALRQALQRTVSDSAGRLRDIVTRVLRLTELERDEVRPANLNDVLEEVRNVLEPPERDRVELHLEPLPPLVCRPQQLTAVFSNLLRNAVQAVEGPGGVMVRSRTAAGAIEVRVKDNGPGLGPEELERIFDPGFRVAGTRIGTGDWSLFASRQVIQDHRGEIRVESAPGRGTVVTVKLPL